ncbi:MAG: sugar nucleotide-binding protein [Candidatus Magasanikbacteria bacterium]|nr:sugar nucleotide-binding protein [Candidatus Magasanikbacteria bacterium]
MQPKRILITGAGQLGTFYKDYFENQGVTVAIFGSELDVRNEQTVREKIEIVNPDLVINTAAKTNIDWCEQNKTEAFEINTMGADVVGRVCQEKNIYLLHISSGCVLESKNAADAQTEFVVPSPLCFYSWTKVWAEEMLVHRQKRHGLQALLLRPRQLLSAKVDPRNALTKMLTYNKFIDTPNSCTVVEDLMQVTHDLISRDETGVYNVVNPGVTTPYEIALALKEIVKPEMEFVKISKEELNKMTLAERVDAVLDTTKLNNIGIHLKEIHERMKEVMVELKKNMDSDGAGKVMEKVNKETKEKLGLVTNLGQY